MEIYEAFVGILGLALWIGAIRGVVVVFGGSKTIKNGWKIFFGVCQAIILLYFFVSLMD